MLVWFFGFLSPKPNKFHLLISGILTFTCVFTVLPSLPLFLRESLPTKLFMRLLLHSLKHVSYRP